MIIHSYSNQSSNWLQKCSVNIKNNIFSSQLPQIISKDKSSQQLRFLLCLSHHCQRSSILSRLECNITWSYNSDHLLTLHSHSCNVSHTTDDIQTNSLNHTEVLTFKFSYITYSAEILTGPPYMTTAGVGVCIYLQGKSEKNNPFNFCSYFSSACKFLNGVLHNC